MIALRICQTTDGTTLIGINAPPAYSLQIFLAVDELGDLATALTTLGVANPGPVADTLRPQIGSALDHLAPGPVNARREAAAEQAPLEGPGPSGEASPRVNAAPGLEPVPTTAAALGDLIARHDLPKSNFGRCVGFSTAHVGNILRNGAPLSDKFLRGLVVLVDRFNATGRWDLDVPVSADGVLPPNNFARGHSGDSEEATAGKSLKPQGPAPADSACSPLSEGAQTAGTPRPAGRSGMSRLDDFRPTRR